MESKTVADYYDQTLVHYRQHWGLDKSHALHYGLWEPQTKNLTQALLNTNKKIARVGAINASMKILDAGCGVGGTAVYLAKQHGCHATGITLSNKQLTVAKELAISQKISHLVSFDVKNYTTTGFPSNYFDIVYGIESVCHANEKMDFIEEAYRLLKPKGKLIVLDFFCAEKKLNTKDKNIMQNWLNHWAIDSLDSPLLFEEKMNQCGFKNIEGTKLTQEIVPSAKILYRAAFLGFLPTKLYAIYNPNVSFYAKNHYKSVYYQYQALKKGLWDYYLFHGEKLE